MASRSAGRAGRISGALMRRDLQQVAMRQVLGDQHEPLRGAEAALANGHKYVALSHNTRLGVAKGLVLVAEYLAHSDLL